MTLNPIRPIGNTKSRQLTPTAQAVHSLCGFDDVPGAVVVHMVFAADILTVAVIVMTLGFDFLRGKR